MRPRSWPNSARAAGITINVIREPGDAYWDNVWMKKPWCMSYWSGRPTADLMFTTAYQTGAAWNDSFWSNAQFDKLLLGRPLRTRPGQAGDHV